MPFDVRPITPDRWKNYIGQPKIDECRAARASRTEANPRHLAKNKCQCWSETCAECMKHVKCKANRHLMRMVLDGYDQGFMPVAVQKDKVPFAGYLFSDLYYREFRLTRKEVEGRFAALLMHNPGPIGYAILLGDACNLCCIDCDTPEAFAALKAEYPDYKWFQETSRGKGHFFFRVPDGIDPLHIRQRIKQTITLKSGAVADGVDIKCGGGYAVGPGSWHEKVQGPYKAPFWPWWDHPVLDLPIDDLLVSQKEWTNAAESVYGAQAPKTLRQIIAEHGTIKERRRKEDAEIASGVRPSRESRLPRIGSDEYEKGYDRAKKYMEKVPGASTGSRNNDCYVHSNKLLSYFALDRAHTDALALILEWASRCSPPLSDREATAVFESAREHGGRDDYGEWVNWKPKAGNGVELNILPESEYAEHDRKKAAEEAQKKVDQATAARAEIDAENEERSRKKEEEEDGDEDEEEDEEDVPSFVTEDLGSPLPDGEGAGCDCGHDHEPDLDLGDVEKPAPAVAPAVARGKNEKKDAQKKYEWPRIDFTTVRYMRSWLMKDATRLAIESAYTTGKESGIYTPEELEKLLARSKRARRNLKKLLACLDGRWKHERHCPTHGGVYKRRYYCRLGALCRWCSQNEAGLASPWCKEKWKASLGGIVTFFSLAFKEPGDVATRAEIKDKRAKIVHLLKRRTDLAHHWIESQREIVVLGDPGLHDAIRGLFAKDKNPTLVGNLEEFFNGDIRVQFIHMETEKAIDKFFEAFQAPSVKLWTMMRKLGKFIQSRDAVNANRLMQEIADFPFVSAYHEQRHAANKAGRESLKYPKAKEIANLALARAAEKNPDILKVEPGRCCERDKVSGIICGKKLPNGHASYAGRHVYKFPDDADARTLSRSFDGVVMTCTALLGKGVKPDALSTAYENFLSPTIKGESLVSFAPKGGEVEFHPRL